MVRRQVVKVTKTQITLSNGNRYQKSTGKVIGNPYTDESKIYLIGKDESDKMNALTSKLKYFRKVDALLRSDQLRWDTAQKKCKNLRNS